MDYMHMMTSSSSLNCLICQQSKKELPAQPISLKNNSTEAVCTHSHKHLYHLLQVLFLDQAQHSDLLHLLHYHLQQEQPSHIRHNSARNPPQAVHYHVVWEHPLLHQIHSHQQQPDGSASSKDIPTKNSPMHSQFTPQDVTPQTSPINQQSPIRTKNNSLSQNSIPALDATVPDTPEEKIPKSLNGEGVKNSRKQATMSTTNAQGSRLCFRCKQPGNLKKDYSELPYCSKCRT